MLPTVRAASSLKVDIPGFSFAVQYIPSSAVNPTVCLLLLGFLSLEATSHDPRFSPFSELRSFVPHITEYNVCSSSRTVSS